MYKYETHLHTSFGSACGRNTGAEMARACKEAGYDGIIVTDHFWGGNTAIDKTLPWKTWVDAFMRGYENAKAEGDKIGLSVFFGWESGFHGTEFLVYGLGREWLYDHPEISHTTIEEQYRLVHEGGGIVVHAHPYRLDPFRPEPREYGDYIDAVEAINAKHSNPVHGRDPMWDRQAVRYAAACGKPMTGGSDIHDTRLIGGGVLSPYPLKSIEDYIELLKGDAAYRLTDGFRDYDRYGKRL